MSRRRASLGADLVFIGLVLSGCGGRATGNGANEVGTSGAASGGAIAGSAGNTPGGAGGSAQTGGTTQAGSSTQAGGTPQAGASAQGGAAGYVTLDDEHAGDGRPVPPPNTAAFFWGSNSAGWRIGNWFVTSDKVRDALLQPIEPPRGDSTEARRASGQGFASGAVLWLQLDHLHSSPVDLSAYSGISFWARLEGTPSTVVVSLNDGSHPSGSLEGRATLPSVPLTPGDTWQQFTLPFAAFGLSQVKLTSVEFFVGDKGEMFDLWIDDFALTCSDACP